MQAGTYIAVHTTELNSAATGTHVGVSTKPEMDQGDQDTTTTVLHEATSWRSRRSALRAAGIKDLVDKGSIAMEQIRGVKIVAYPWQKFYHW